MTFKWTDSEGKWVDIYKLNPVLRGIREFHGDPQNEDEYPKLPPRIMRWVMLVADAESPCRKLGATKRRTSSCVIMGMVDQETGRLTKEGMELVSGENKYAERAIKRYQEDFTPDSVVETQEMIDVMRDQLESIKNTLRYAKVRELFSDQSGELSNNDIKVMAQANTILDKRLDRQALDAMRQYENELDTYNVVIPPDARAELERHKQVDDSKPTFDTADTSKFTDR